MGNLDYRQAASLLRSQDRILILTHKRPDGDTIGSAAGLCRALRQIGKTAWLLPNEDATPLFTPYCADLLLPEGERPDFVVSVDIAGRSLFTPEGSKWLNRGIDLGIDHHPSYEGFADVSCVDPSCAACGEIIFQIVRELCPLTAEIAEPLYVAISTDTGCFVYSNTTPQTHRAAADLMATGIAAAALNKKHFRTKTWKRLKIESLLVEGMDLHDGGKIAIAAVTLKMMDALKATEADVEDIAAFAGQTQGVETAVTIRELRDGTCKLSVRTSGALSATKICALLGGGGHAAAAGCTVQGSVAEAKRVILAAIRQVQTA